MPKSTPRDDYEAKTRHETARATRRATLRPNDSGAGEPFGDPLSGVVIVAEPPASAGSIDALRRSLAAVNLDDAYVVWPTPALFETLLSVEPGVLVAVGPAAREVDALEYPLVENPFSGASEGRWFSWTKGTLGLLLPALAPALGDDDAKRRFWRAFVALRDLTPEGKVRA